MTVPGNLSSPLLATAAEAAEAAANITKSLRFNDPDTASLSKTFSSAGNRKTWTWSCWAKRGNDDSSQLLLSANDGSGSYTEIRFTGDVIGIQANNIASPNEWKTDALFRDHSAWYHIVCAIDTTNATAASRIKVYVNGVAQTFSQSPAVTQNSDLYVNAAVSHSIGKRDSSSTSNFDGYLADIYFIDGSQLDATSFGAYDDNGVWQSAAYSGTFGTNGFHLLDFANESTVGHDSSGNNNDFTANNISTSAGAGNDVLFDVPTNGSQSDSGAGGEVSGCYATLNPLQAITNSPTNGNLDIGGSSTSTYTKAVSTIYIDPEDTTGYYCEFTVADKGTNPAGHIQLLPPSINLSSSGAGMTGGVGLVMRGGGGGNKWWSLTDQSATTDTGVAHADDQVIGVAVKNGKLYMAINNTWVLSGNPATESNPLFSSLSGLKGFLVGTTDGDWQCNWGQRAFSYSAPTGYRAVSSASLPTPTIADGSDYFDTLLWTGDNAVSRTLTGLEFSPDFVWHQARSIAWGSGLVDAVRGVGSGGPTLRTFNNSAEETVNNFGAVTALTSNGFTVSKGGFGSNQWAYVNQSGATYVAWAWDAGSSTASNTDGSITSSVRANQTAGFSIVSYTGSGSNATVGHGLNAALDFIIVKRRDSAGEWRCWHNALANNKGIDLNSTGPAFTDDSFNNTIPTSSVFSIKGGVGNVNASSATYLALCFSTVEGYSAFGSYEATGSAPIFVHTGFSPAWVIIKDTDSTGPNWLIFDNKRDPYNLASTFLRANVAGEEIDNQTANGSIDFLSNGFAVRASGSSSTNTTINVPNTTVIWAAFAQNPFQANGGLAR